MTAPSVPATRSAACCGWGYSVTKPSPGRGSREARKNCSPSASVTRTSGCGRLWVAANSSISATSVRAQVVLGGQRLGRDPGGRRSGRARSVMRRGCGRAPRRRGRCGRSVGRVRLLPARSRYAGTSAAVTTPCCAVISSTIGQISAILLGRSTKTRVGRNVACEGAEAVAEGPLVAGEPPLAAQGGDSCGARLSQAPRQGGVDGAAVGTRGLAGVDAQRHPDRGFALAGVGDQRQRLKEVAVVLDDGDPLQVGHRPGEHVGQGLQHPPQDVRRARRRSSPRAR